MKYFTHIWALVTGLLLAVFIHGCMQQHEPIEKAKAKTEVRR